MKTETVGIWRWNGEAEIRNEEYLSLRAFRGLVHDAETVLVIEMCDRFPRLCEMVGAPNPDILPLTADEYEILKAAMQAQTVIREEIHPWTSEPHEEYRGMRIMVGANAEAKRREMIES